MSTRDQEALGQEATTDDTPACSEPCCEYLAHDGVVFCTRGSDTTTMVASVNSKNGCNHVIVDTDTPPDSFADDFGICKTLTARNGKDTQCEIRNLPLWFNTNKEYTVEGRPTVLMSSFAVCFNGIGSIIPEKDGQTQEDFNLLAFLLNALLGRREACASAIDPINMATGNFFYSKDDIEVTGQFPIIFNRFYNAMDDSPGGVLGKGWTHSYNIFLTKDKNDRNVKITFDDGHVEDYYRRDDGSYTSSQANKSTLEQFQNGYILIIPSMESYYFDKLGRLFKICDLSGNETVLQYYKDNGLLGKISSACGSLSFAYNKESQITKITDHTGRVAMYEYSGKRLISVTNVAGAVYRYEYGEGGKVSKVINPLGISVILNEYDEKQRTVNQSFADGGVAKIKYHKHNPYTILTEQNGNEVTYVRDEQFRTTQIAYQDGSHENFDYNKQNKRTIYVDRNSNAHNFDYDELGNLTRITNPLGGSVCMEYDKLNRPTKITTPGGGVTVYEYDLKGNMIKTTDPLQRETSFSHNTRGLVILAVKPDNSENAIERDERGNITSVTDGVGATSRYEYDNLNRVVKTTNGEGHITLLAYNSKGHIEKVTDAEGKVCHYDYNLSGKVTRIIDFDGGVTEYKYNNVDKIEEIIDQAGGSTKFTYDLMWNVTSVTDPCGNTVKYVYDQYQRVIQSVDGEGNITRYEHDPKGNITAVISPIGGRTEISYDALDRQTKIIEPDGAITVNEYDSVGNIIAVTDALGNTTRREYDLAGQMIKLTDPLGNQTKFTYTQLGRIKSVTNPAGGKIMYSYYPGGKVKTVTMPSGESESYEYDKNGNVVSVTNAMGAQTQLKYDQLDRVIETVDPLGHSKKFSYDALGNITGTTDEKGNLTQYKYSLLGDVIEIIDAKGHSTKFGYDAMRRLTKFEQFRMIEGNIAGMKMSEYQITTYERNKNGEVVEVKSPLGKVVKLGYNAIGNLTSKLDEDGLETLYEYDLASKLTKISYADGKTVEYGYNLLKQLTVMEDWLGVTKIEVDPLGRATKVTDPQDNVVGYKWNALGQKEELTYPDGSQVSYEYDASGRMKKVRSPQGMTSYAYDRMGRLSERVLPDKTTTKYKVNPLGRLSALTHSRGGDLLDSFKYSYDPTGNITQIEKQRVGMEADSGIFGYSYDSLGRLRIASHGDDWTIYNYDELGNRTGEWRGKRLDPRENWTVHSYNKRNQLIKTTEPDDESVTKYSYDGRGNLTQVSVKSGLKSQFEFDATNMMVGAFAPGKGRAEYTYNGFRNRVAKLEDLTGFTSDIAPVRDVKYTSDMTLPYDNLLEMRGEKKQNFVWGNGLISSFGDEKFHYVQDHLGSPVRLLGDSGLDEALAYDEFGMQTFGGHGNLNNPFAFTSYMADDISDMYFVQARYYMPQAGRFSAEDLVRDGFNWYTFCGNDPINFVDPDGLCRQCAREYMENYAYNRNPDFPNWPINSDGTGGNCANFVSQTLLAGGVQPTLYEWFITSHIVANNWFTRGSMSSFAFQNRTFARRDISFNNVLPNHQVLVSSSWNSANAQFNYFSNPRNGFINGDPILIDRNTDLEQLLRENNVQVGDLLYWRCNRRGRMTHAGIISRVTDTGLYFAANTTDRLDRDVLLGIGDNQTLRLVLLNDEVFSSCEN